MSEMTREEVIENCNAMLNCENGDATRRLAHKKIIEHDAAIQSQLAALRLRWTSDKPKAPGWYWWLSDFPDSEPQCVEVVLSSSTKVLVALYNLGAQTPVARLDGEWAGPIPLPQGRERLKEERYQAILSKKNPVI